MSDACDQDRTGCAACRISLEQWCRQGAPPKLCGLCELMGPELLARYLEIWDPPAIELPAPKKSEDAV